jgi:hypothetical protein
MLHAVLVGKLARDFLAQQLSFVQHLIQFSEQAREFVRRQVRPRRFRHRGKKITNRPFAGKAERLDGLVQLAGSILSTAPCFSSVTR